jgi:hypothetical protein
MRMIFLGYTLDLIKIHPPANLVDSSSKASSAICVAPKSVAVFSSALHVEFAPKITFSVMSFPLRIKRVTRFTARIDSSATDASRRSKFWAKE